MKINKDVIKKFNPCRSGLFNYLKYHSDFNGKISEFLALEKISYSNKIWLVRRIVPIDILKQWAVECSEFVAYIYNDQYPNDSRINECIEYTKLYLEGKTTLEKLRAKGSAAYTATYAAYVAADVVAYTASYAAYVAADVAAYVAADVVAYTASYAAYVAADVAAYVAADVAADVAAYAANATDADDRQNQNDINLSILIALLDNINE